MRGEPQVVVEAKAVLGEGAIWDTGRRRLYWVDIMGEMVHVFDPATGRDQVMPAGGMVGTVVPRRRGVVIARKDGFVAMDLERGRMDVLRAVTEEPPTNRFNDGKCDPAGRLWAGTMSLRGEKGAGTLWRLDADLSLHPMVRGVSISNGIAWTADRRTMYYIDTPTRQIAAWDYDDASGEISNRRVVAQTEPALGHPDGMTIDEAGRLWVAMWGGGRVCCFDPGSGKVVDQVAVSGAKLTSSCAFGGEALDDLYITTARQGLGAEALREQPLAGNMFRVKMDVRGVPAEGFAG